MDFGGLLDNFSFPDLNDPKKMGLLMAAAGLLGRSPREPGNFGTDLSRGLLGGLQGYSTAQQSLLKQQADERANRANDLQQQVGLYSMLQQDEFPKMWEAQSKGLPYTPSEAMQAVTANIRRLTGNQELSGKVNGPKAAGAPPAPAQPASLLSPQLPTLGSDPSQNISPDPSMLPQRPQQQPPPQMPPQSQGSLPMSAGGIPLAMWAAGSKNPGALKFMETIAKSKEPLNVRPGGTVGGYDPNTNQFSPAFIAPNFDKGIQPNLGPNNTVSASPVPGYLDAIARLKAVESGASKSGALPYEPPTVYNTPGAPTALTPSQAITRATGSPPPPPFVEPQVQTTRNAQQIAILQKELFQEPDPKNRAAIQTEIAALQGAQARGQPFTSQQPNPGGIVLQDQGAGAEQKKLGEELGQQGAEIIKNGNASMLGKFSLRGMSDMAKSYQPGLFQPMLSKFAQYASQLPGVTEDDMNRILKTNAGDIQGLTSAAIIMAGKLTRQSDSQPSQLQFFKTLESMPSAQRSAQGFSRIMDYLNSVHDYNIEEMRAYNQWLQTHKDTETAAFMAEWSKKAATMPFVWNQPIANQGGWSVKRIN